ncbi:MAG: hypothetical protein WCL71_07785, partial [Deltaproteobacteria bacterium]
SKQRILAEAVISRVDRIEIADPMRTRETWGIAINGECLSLTECTKFASGDGFADLHAMLSWFHVTHGLPFNGVVIYWQNDERTHGRN